MRNTIFFLLLSGLCWFTACQKGNSPQDVSPVLSSDKTIQAVQFKATDNPSLSVDIAGVIGPDTIKFQIPTAVSLGSLIPTISFTGKSINPVNKSAQNFTGPVSYTITAEDGSSRNYILFCQREQTDTAHLIAGRWKIFKDSLSNVGNFYFIENGFQQFPTPGVYYGTNADYWDFNLNGTLSIFENNNGGNTTYQLLSDGKLSVSALTMYNAAIIQTLNANAAAFIWTQTSPNGGQYYRKLYLIK